MENMIIVFILSRYSYRE